MAAKEAIKHHLEMTYGIFTSFFSDLTDSDLLVRPVPGANHIAWQLGHLIGSDVSMGSTIHVKGLPELPAGFKEAHSKATAMIDPPTGFLKKDEYLALKSQIQTAYLTTLEGLSDSDLGTKTEGTLENFAPTHAAVFMLLGSHTMMHVGQFTVLRRKLEKPVLF